MGRKGLPGELAGDAVPLLSRVAQISEFVGVAHRVGGADAAAALARRQSGRQFDPSLARLVQEEPEELFATLDEIATWDAVIESEPALAVVLSEERFDRSLEAIDVRPDEDVLDVACGTGNAAICAAQAGGAVVGVDLTPEPFEAGRRLAAAAAVEVEWVQGDAEELPFADDELDVVLSTFGCMFAPRHEVTARELARVLRPGGRMALASWTPDGAMGEFFRRVGAFLPPPPPIAQPSTQWGSAQHVRELFAGTGIELSFERDSVSPVPFDSENEAVEYMSTKFGPLIMARQLTEASGRWQELRGALGELYGRETGFEYLVVLGRKEES